jgi:predicted molibdopterin-dependent oxidoreductase YjgC
MLGPGTARSDATIFSQIAARLRSELAFATWEEVFAQIARVVPGWGEGVRLGAPRPPLGGAPARAAAAPRTGAGGALILLTGTRLFNRGTMAIHCPGIRNQAGEPFVALHPEDALRLGVSDGMPCEVRSSRGALRLMARVWAGLAPGQAYIPRGFDAAPVNSLEDERGAVAVTVQALAAADAAG